MPKSFDAEPAAPQKLATYTVKLDDARMAKLEAVCRARGWEPMAVEHTRFAFKGDKVNVSAYKSGKVVIAGKGTEDFVTMTLEPEVTGEARLGYDDVRNPEWFEAHAGLDESGKGDFFGPVVAATVIATAAAIKGWREAGVMDSKRIADPQILRLDRLIRETPGVVFRTVYFGMPKYNEEMAKPRANLNLLLAWQHAVALEDCLKRQATPWGLLDQFSEQPLVQRELKKKGWGNFDLRMRTKAEEDPVVAAASIVARAEFVRIMNKLSERFGKPLLKGASAAVKDQGREIIERFGAKALGDFAKLHFRTAYEVVRDAGKLDELPLKEPKARFGFGRD